MAYPNPIENVKLQAARDNTGEYKGMGGWSKTDAQLYEPLLEDDSRIELEDNFQDYYQGDFWERYFDLDYIEHTKGIFRKILEKCSGKVLDVKCGTGLLAKVAKEEFPEITVYSTTSKKDVYMYTLFREMYETKIHYYTQWMDVSNPRVVITPTDFGKSLGLESSDTFDYVILCRNPGADKLIEDGVTITHPGTNLLHITTNPPQDEYLP